MPLFRKAARGLSILFLTWLGILGPSAQDEIQAPGARHLTQPGATQTRVVERVEHNVLHRPIALADDKNHWIDRTYAYGSTQFNSRPVHLGVEFVNARETPVFAAKAGRVIFAGSDASLQLGPQVDYYGNVVVLAHELYSLAGRQIFTLYGHLERVNVQAGQLLADMDQIGTVGSSGVAIGPHLHFEVRAGDPYSYRQTRNPELWLQHYVDSGMIVGSLRHQNGEPIYGRRVTIRSEAGSRDVFTYASALANGDPVWRENFVVADLPAGNYEIVHLDDKGLVVFRDGVRVDAYRTTFVEIVLPE
ncbi:MAG: M23 family metallopeptidase [Chloroflexi bacterium]|nr:M23 family metallopeptidase [Chloroflexota bacterium]